MVNFQPIQSLTMDQNFVRCTNDFNCTEEQLWNDNESVVGSGLSHWDSFVDERNEWHFSCSTCRVQERLSDGNAGTKRNRSLERTSSESQLTIPGITFLLTRRLYRKTYRTFPQSLFQLSRRHLANCHCVPLRLPFDRLCVLCRSPMRTSSSGKLFSSLILDILFWRFVTVTMERELKEEKDGLSSILVSWKIRWKRFLHKFTFHNNCN